MDLKKSHVDTKLAHLGRDPKNCHGMVNTPVFRTSTLLFDKVEDIYKIDHIVHTDKSYGRSGTPTVHELQNAMAELDGVNNAIVTSSGMHAISLAMLSLLKAGDHILITDSAYKCTLRFAEEELARFGIEYSLYPHDDESKVEQLIQKNTKMIWLESPGSGLYNIQNIDTLVGIAKKHKLISITDNTWATALLFKPFEKGIDVCVQSLSKYISGHSDILLGCITTQKESLYNKIYSAFRNHGAIPSPDNCYLALRGLRTLSVRLKRHEESSIIIAKWLQKQPNVTKVLHPALTDSKYHQLWKNYFLGSSGTFGAIFECKSEKRLFKFINALEIFGIGLSWGGYESLALPYQLPKDVRQKHLNMNEHLVRFHIGLESPDDLIVHLNNALKYLSN